jgi:23S rRNA (guanosine2251-2'-O)-methyltransferase
MSSPTLITGRKPVFEALRSGTPIDKVLFLAGVQGRVISDIRSLAQAKGIEVSDLNRTEFRELASDATTQGVVAMIPARRFVDLDFLVTRTTATGKGQGFLLILDEIEDPQNLGALIRTAECAGVHGVVIPKHHAATVTSTVVKASAGATEHMAIAEVTNIVNTIEELKEHGFWVVGLDGAAEKEYTTVDYTSPVALVVGNEGRGIRRLVREHCDHLVRIPLYGNIQSLNASVAGAIVMYAVAAQRRTAPDSGDSLLNGQG